MGGQALAVARLPLEVLLEAVAGLHDLAIERAAPLGGFGQGADVCLQEIPRRA